MDKEMLEAMRAMFDERDEKMRAMFDERDERLSQMMVAKLEPIKAQLDKQAAYERGTRAIIENRVMPAIQTVAEQNGEIIDWLKKVEARRETSQALRSRVRTLEDVVRSHTDRIEALEARAE